MTHGQLMIAASTSLTNTVYGTNEVDSNGTCGKVKNGIVRPIPLVAGFLWLAW